MQFGERCWAIEGASNRFIVSWVEALLGAGERVVNISPNLTSQYRARRGKKKDDRIDAENAARVLLANPKLPELRLCDAQQHLKVLTRTRQHLRQQLQANRAALASHQQETVRNSLKRLIAALKEELGVLDKEVKSLVKALLPELSQQQGIGNCVAGVILAEVGDIRRFSSEDAFAHYCGAAPLPKSSGKNQRAQLNPHGNRRLNWALHIIALTRLRLDPASQALVARKRQQGKTQREALRVLKTYIARGLYRFLKNHPVASCS